MGCRKCISPVVVWMQKGSPEHICLNMPEDGAVLEGVIGSGTSLNSSLATLTVILCFLSRDIM